MAMRLKTGDFFIFAAAALLAAGSLLLGMGARRAGAGTAEIYMEGRLVRTVDLGALSAPVEFELAGACRNRIVAERGRIRFVWSDCPDGVCVRTGWISRVGQTAACVPNRVLIKITGDAGEDTVVR